jgi:hypothetical protein
VSHDTARGVLPFWARNVTTDSSWSGSDGPSTGSYFGALLVCNLAAVVVVTGGAIARGIEFGTRSCLVLRYVSDHPAFDPYLRGEQAPNSLEYFSLLTYGRSAL